ncbi:alpha/beta fold hydrolase [Patescibacteria group bacterium]
MKKQVVVIHGGGVFISYKQYINFLKKRKLNFIELGKKDWKATLENKLGGEFEVILPKMPNKDNARYEEWKIWFEKFIPFLEKEVVLVGHSLGGIFLSRYLSENKFPKKILAVFFVAASYDSAKSPARTAGFVVKNDLKLIEKQSRKVIFYHSRDDRSVPFSSFEEYKKLLTRSVFREYKNRGHFNQNNFPELVRDIKKAFAKKSN